MAATNGANGADGGGANMPIAAKFGLPTGANREKWREQFGRARIAKKKKRRVALLGA